MIVEILLCNLISLSAFMYFFIAYLEFSFLEFKESFFKEKRLEDEKFVFLFESRLKILEDANLRKKNNTSRVSHKDDILKK